MITAQKHWADEELLAMPRGGKREIVRGELIVMSPASFNHGAVIARLMGALATEIHRQGTGELADGQTGFRLSTGDLFCPDISFVSKDRVAAHRQKGDTFFRGAPELVVEVLSPSDTVEVMQEKLEQFFADGTRLAWIINPRSRSVHVYRSPTIEKVLRANDMLDGEDLVPGFAIPVSLLFI